MLWLIIALISYFFLSLTAVGDKYLISGVLNARTYTFYAGILGAFVFLLIPFINFSVPEPGLLFFCFITGFFFIIGSYIFYTGLEKYEVSRIVPATGGLLPVFTFILSFFLLKTGASFNFYKILAFLVLISGTFLITKTKGSKFSLRSFSIAALSSLFFAFYFVFSKQIYSAMPFWNAVILIRFGAFLPAVLFIFTKDVRKEIFSKKPQFSDIRTSAFFVINQCFAATGVVLQNWSVALADAYYVAFINALDGTRYVFIFIFSSLASWKFPRILKEETSESVVSQKLTAIFLIIAGLVFLAF